MSESIDRAGWDRAESVCLCQAEAGRRSSCSRRICTVQPSCEHDLRRDWSRPRAWNDVRHPRWVGL